jgi:hypothetical protein
VNDHPECSSALSDGVSDDRMGAGDPSETAVSSADWARNGFDLPPMPVDLFAEAAASLAREAEPGTGERLRWRADAQAAVLRWTTRST